MICLTGDLHHSSLRTGNQLHADDSEIRIAGKFLRLLGASNVKVTFFVSGKSFREEWPDLRPIVEHPLVEVGGHNWSCFQPELLHRVSKKLLGSYNGPSFYQRLDAELTARVVRARTGKRIRAWRNHMYMHGPHTERVLTAAGLTLCSDGTDREGMGPVRHATGIYNFPLNVIPDHEHLYHAERTREWVARWQKRYSWSDDWGPESHDIADWVEIVLGDLERNEARGAISNMIIHPITMYLCDGFEGFRKILRFLESRETVHLLDVVPKSTR